MKEVTRIIFIIFWVLGIAVSHGFWTILAEVVCPPVAWVMFAKWLIEKT